MNGKQLLGLVAALLVSVPAFAAADQYLYNDGSLTAQGVVAVQQHSVYVEIIKEEVREQEQLHQFAAVIALVKRCIQREQKFDNAVLWFNDQFLFGEKKVRTENITEGPVLGAQPDENLNDTKDNPTWDTDDSAKFIRRFGGPDYPQTWAAGDVPGRWVGCFIPEGFLHAIGSDDPYATGTANTEVDVQDDDNPELVVDNIGLVKDLIDLDNNPACSGCVFDYSGSFYITDPNGFNWLIDKFVYPSVLGATNGGYSGTCSGQLNAHINSDLAYATGCDAEQHRDDNVNSDGACGPSPSTLPAPRDEGCGDGDGDDVNHCYEDDTTPERCDGDHSDPTDTPRRESTKATTLEPLYTVHLQVDTDLQAVRDEALWAWRSSGLVRPGVPRYENSPNTPCADSADAAGPTTACPTTGPWQDPSTDLGEHNPPSSAPDDGTGGRAVEYNNNTGPGFDTFADQHSYCPSDEAAIAGGDATKALDVRCSIEYTALIVVDFEAFDDIGVLFDGDGEDEIARTAKSHGTGAADDGDESKSGNSHAHNADGAAVGDNAAADSGPSHDHDAVLLDLFFKYHFDAECDAYKAGTPVQVDTSGTVDPADPPVTVTQDACGAPHFTIVNGGFRSATGAPPAANVATCDDGGVGHPEGGAPLQARTFIVCDIDDDAGEFHAHDGSETIG